MAHLRRSAAFALVILLFLLRPHHAEQLVKKGDVPSPPVPEEASPIPTVTIPPSGAPTSPAETPQDVSPTPASSAAPSFAPDGFQLDPRLIGAWETKGPWPPNSGRIQTVHWTIETDGHFTFSRTLVRRGSDHRIERQDEMVFQQQHRLSRWISLTSSMANRLYTRAAW